jgi:hypothetical protein
MTEALKTPLADVYTRNEIVDVRDIRVGQRAAQLVDRTGRDDSDRIAQSSEEAEGHVR